MSSLFFCGFNSQELFSTDVIGLVAKLPAGKFIKGNGNLIFTISGKTNTGGNAKFNLSLGGKSCVIEINVVATKTPKSGYGPSVTYVEGNVYKTVYRGSQQWMAKNLTTEKYNDGTLIANVQNELEWSSTKNGAWCNYEHNSVNGSNDGKLYNGFAVQTQKLFPTGWHMPTKILLN